MKMGDWKSRLLLDYSELPLTRLLKKFWVCIVALFQTWLESNFA